MTVVDVLALPVGARIEVAPGRTARVTAPTDRCPLWPSAVVHTDDRDYLVSLPCTAPLAAATPQSVTPKKENSDA